MMILGFFGVASWRIAGAIRALRLTQPDPPTRSGLQRDRLRAVFLFAAFCARQALQLAAGNPAALVRPMSVARALSLRDNFPQKEFLGFSDGKSCRLFDLA
jgi:hypothetical protein